MDYASNGVNSEALPYVDPVQTIKDHPKVTSSDYQEIPAFEAYSNPSYEEKDVPYEYETSIVNYNNDSEEDIHVEALPEGEKIYEDPGHVEEHIYAWFEQRKFRMLKKANIRLLIYIHCSY